MSERYPVRRQVLTGIAGLAGGLAAGPGSIAASDHDEPAETIAVQSFDFDPDDVEIEVGETIRWEWEGNNHNVSPTFVPDGAEWDGEADGTFDAGHTYEHTFTTAGNYEYECQPHSASMQASLTVTEEVDYADPDGSVFFESPADGDEVESPVSVALGAETFTVEDLENGVRDGHGHLHVLVDEPFVDPGQVIPSDEGYVHLGDGSLATDLDLDPGTYTLRLQAGDADHRAYDLTDELTVTVSGDDGDQWWGPYTDENDVASSAGDHVVPAIQDFEATGEPGAGQVVTLIESFETSQPVPELIDE